MYELKPLSKSGTGETEWSRQLAKDCCTFKTSHDFGTKSSVIQCAVLHKKKYHQLLKLKVARHDLLKLDTGSSGIAW